MNDDAVVSVPAVDSASAAVDSASDAPQDTADVINQSLEGLDDSDTDDGGSTVQDAAPAEPQERDELAEELGLNPNVKNNRIPYKRVKQIVENAKKQLQAQIQERDAKLANLSRYEAPEVQHALSAFQALEQDPKRFLDALASVDPRYAEILTPRQQQEAQQQQAGHSGDVAPDLLLPDGSFGYSAEAMQRLVDAKTQQIEQRIERKFEEQFGPVASDWRQNQIMRGAVSKAKEQIAQAEQWPGFSEHKADIINALKSNNRLSLEQAYINIVAPKLIASKDEVRKQVLAEVSTRKPTAARGSVAPSHGSVTPNTNRSVEDIIRESIAGLE